MTYRTKLKTSQQNSLQEKATHHQVCADRLGANKHVSSKLAVSQHETSQREEKNPFAGNFASLGIEARWSSPRLHALVRVSQSDQHLCAGIQKDEESDTAMSLLKNRAHRLEHGVLEGVRPPSNNRATLNTVTADTSYISTVSDHNC